MNSLQESHLEDERRLRVQADGEGVAIARVQSELGNQAAHHELQVREGGDGSSNRGGEVEERRVGAEQEILGRAQIIIIQPSQKYSEQETVQSPPTHCSMYYTTCAAGKSAHVNEKWYTRHVHYALCKLI